MWSPSAVPTNIAARPHLLPTQRIAGAFFSLLVYLGLGRLSVGEGGEEQGPGNLVQVSLPVPCLIDTMPA